MSGHLLDTPGISRKNMRVLGKYALVYILRGRGCYRDENGHKAEFGAGSLLCLFPDIAHSYEPVDAARWDEIYLIFSGAQFDLLRKKGVISEKNPVRTALPVDYWRTRLMNLAKQTVCRNERQSLAEVIELSSILAEIDCAEDSTQGADGDEEWLTRAKMILNEDLRLGPEACARHMNMAYETFRKKFTKLAGLSPGRYLTRKLMEKAAAMIIHDRKPSKVIAEELGFCDEFHFSRRFRAVMGMSPKNYRQCLPRR